MQSNNGVTRFDIYDNAHLFQKDTFRKLKKNDINALVIFLMFMLGKIPEYVILSRMFIMTDCNIFLKLCEYFGGETITIPTLDEMNEVLSAIKMYSMIDVDGLDYNQVINQLGVGPNVIADYNKLKLVLEQYGIEEITDTKN